MEGAVEGVVVRGRVQIDTRQPFRSVKEAVLMFGEKILAPEIYAKQINTQVLIFSSHSIHSITFHDVYL